MEQTAPRQKPLFLDPGAAEVSLRGYYLIALVALGVGLLVVLLLNLATPLDYLRARMLELWGFLTGGGSPGQAFFMLIAIPLVLTLACLLALLNMRWLLRPVSGCLAELRQGGQPDQARIEAARLRLLNLPFLFIPLNVAPWLFFPALIAAAAYLWGQTGGTTSLVLAARASMVGFITSAIGFFRLEAHSRRRLIPFFFPDGGLSRVPRAARLSISRRIRIFYRMGSLIPLTILVVTVFTLQWQVDSRLISAQSYDRGILIFILVLTLWAFVAGGVLNRLVSRSIVEPVQSILSGVELIEQGRFGHQVPQVSNDEIGVLAEAANQMSRGLAEREKMRAVFGRYVSLVVRDEILGGRIPLDGEIKDVTVLFADLRDFTPLAGSLPPRQVVGLINGYFARMTRAIEEQGGLVLQFIGDEIMAVFGAPLPLAEHPQRALAAARQMNRQLEDYNRTLAAQGLPELSHGIGLHSGSALAANIGGPQRLSYTLVGAAVNLASRLQGLCKERGVSLLLSADTAARLPSRGGLERLPAARLKGFQGPVEVFTLL